MYSSKLSGMTLNFLYDFETLDCFSSSSGEDADCACDIANPELRRAKDSILMNDCCCWKEFWRFILKCGASDNTLNLSGESKSRFFRGSGELGCIVSVSDMSKDV